MDDKERQELLDRHATMLREHFDSVLILAAREEGKLLRNFEAGTGSWFERFALARLWVIRKEEAERENERQFESESDSDQSEV